jgi:DNA-binding response OmpR family regulator
MRGRILVVDDEPDFVASLVHRLQLRDFEAVGIDGGEAALEKLRDWPADVVVLDVKMPGIDGLETLRRLGASHPGLAVIMLTGHGSQKLNDTGLELGAFDYLIKPVRLDVLIERIEAAIEQTSQPSGS